MAMRARRQRAGSRRQPCIDGARDPAHPTDIEVKPLQNGNGRRRSTSTEAAAERTVHHFTVDVEEYFQVVALSRVVERSRWESYESRVERSTDLILELLDQHDVRGTFFTLGWIAKRYPELVRRITENGHELASHGSDHRRVTELSPDEFRESVRSSKAILEDVGGESIRGYRAPSFSIIEGGEWALEILVEEGYSYDSSLFPIRRPGYGYPKAQRDPCTLETPAGPLGEFPLTTYRAAGLRLPAAGGAYFRLLPYALVASGLRQAERRGAPATFYLHPWEVDPDQPRQPVPPLTRIRHYGGLHRTLPRLERLLREFRFGPIATTLAGMRPGAVADV